PLGWARKVGRPSVGDATRRMLRASDPNACLIGSAGGLGSRRNKVRRSAMTANADRILKDGVSKGDVPGVTAAATNAKGTTYEAGFGKRVLGESADMTPDTVVWIASMTKAVTGAAAMQLLERGKLGLDSPAKEVVPELGKVGVLEGFDSAGKPKLRPP